MSEQKQNNPPITQEQVIHRNDTAHPLYAVVIDQLMTVYDPEVPLIDIYTLGLIYGITFDDATTTVNIIMTFTTPACPMGDLLKSMTTDAVHRGCPGRTCLLEITFDPMRGPAMIKDEDLQRMFV
ncbi:MAG: metal-sulfur cluster assembly factor [Candidatus Absconditabacterales bacterium]|nr:metal-sulfur cluster assembly factor [Candidatus Absconditabacterales bacterium]